MFDFSSDLHFDNAMAGGPLGWLGTIDVRKYKNSGSKVLLIAGDTSNSLTDTVDFLNAAAEHYERVIAVLETERHENVHLSIDLMVDGYRLFTAPEATGASGVTNSHGRVSSRHPCKRWPQPPGQQPVPASGRPSADDGPVASALPPFRIVPVI